MWTEAEMQRQQRSFVNMIMTHEGFEIIESLILIVEVMSDKVGSVSHEAHAGS